MLDNRRETACQLVGPCDVLICILSQGPGRPRALTWDFMDDTTEGSHIKKCENIQVNIVISSVKCFI